MIETKKPVMKWLRKVTPLLAMLTTYLIVISAFAQPRSVEQAIDQLKSSNSQVRKEAVLYLKEAQNGQAIEPLIRVLREDKDPVVRIAAAVALGDLKDKRAVDALVVALKDEYSEVRQFSALALGEIGDTRAIEPLIDALGAAEYHAGGAIVTDMATEIRVVEALKKLTGQDLGWDQKEWSDWWKNKEASKKKKKGIHTIKLELNDNTTVYQAQKKLQDLGYNPGPLDGLWGIKTEKAIKEFQRKNGLPVTGKLDKIVRKKLYIDTKKDVKGY